jgi:hypothetical protein
MIVFLKTGALKIILISCKFVLHLFLVLVKQVHIVTHNQVKLFKFNG